ncbi:MAG: insulinase family protein [Elusimicrobiales bacterium]|nr:insulinase family protein [Elusimicrobiales bacterium]
MKKTAFLAAALLALTSFQATAAEPAEKNLPEGAIMETDSRYPNVISYTLKNGLKLLILEKKFVPTVSFTTMFKVGNVDCVQGKTGLAHMFEHMAFKGSKTMNALNYSKEKKALAKEESLVLELQEEEHKLNPDAEKVKKLREQLAEASKEADSLINKDEYWKIYNNLGENGMNAMTSLDYTGYVVQLPADRLEHWMIIESDRFKNFVLREFYKERSVIMEERRMGESNVGRILNEALNAAAFVSHPYHNPIIGWMDDIANLTRTDAEKFYAKYYVPSNATIAVVGDVNPAEVIRLANKYFGSWKGGTAKDEVRIIEPKQNAEKKINVFFPAQPALRIGYHNPGIYHPDMPALIMASEVLSNGKTGRFYKNLVEGKQMALYAGSYPSLASRYPSLFIIAAAPKAPFTNEQLDEAILEEIENLSKNPPQQWELDKILNNYEADMIKQMESNAGIGMTLAHSQQIIGDWKYDWDMSARLRSVTPEQISKAVRKYLVRPNRTVVYLTAPEEK